LIFFKNKTSLYLFLSRMTFMDNELNVEELLRHQLDYCYKYNSTYFLNKIINSNFDFSSNLENLFLIKCIDGNLDIVRYLLSNINFNDLILNEGFHYACQNFHLDISKLLLSTGKINLNSNIADVFINSFNNNNTEMMNWIMTISNIEIYQLIRSRLWKQTDRLKLMKLICNLKRIS
jgi:ankyrin repeat protein